MLALGMRDPVSCWKRRWDGKWRMVLFDVPQSKASDRARLRRSLADRGFGYLQNSVWITPDPLTEEREALGAGRVDVESLIILEARPCAGAPAKLCRVRDKVLQVVTHALRVGAPTGGTNC